MFRRIWGEISSDGWFNRMRTVKQSLAWLLISLVVVGCASTGIVPIGKDTYMVSKQSATGYESAVGNKGQVLVEANKFCTRQGLVMVLVSLNTKDGVPGRSYATAELVFRAVGPEDAENQRPKLERAPDATIEVRNR